MMLATFLAVFLLLFLAIVIGAALLRASLPQRSGRIQVTGVIDRVRIERDAAGVPRIIAEHDSDVAFGLGFVHAQDRFFQMDLLRRRSAGELAELVGAVAVNLDTETRRHQFRKRAIEVADSLSPDDRRWLDAYVDGVNQGLESLGRKPPEYYVLRTDPAPWAAADSVLVLYSMFLQLQQDEFSRESALGTLAETMPGIYRFLTDPGDIWDAPLDGSVLSPPPIPEPADIDLRQQVGTATSDARFLAEVRKFREPPMPGSNQWAVAGRWTESGAALVANDMHLSLTVPNIWYRATLRYPGTEDRPAIEVTGVTVPGGPCVVVGSNGHIAWSFTNSRGDWSDLVLVDEVAGQAEHYRSESGTRAFETEEETILVKGGEPRTMVVKKTIWGPVVGQDYRGRSRVLRWVAHDREAVDLRIRHLATTTNVNDAVRLAANCGAPHLNLIVGDSEGHIGWTILGRIPRRVGFTGRHPTSWSDGTRGWSGYYDPDEYPRIVDPPSGLLWTANARVVGGEDLRKIGIGGYDRGVRASIIRDALRETTQDGRTSEHDLLDIQLLDRDVLHERWRSLLLDLLADADERDGNDSRRRLREIVDREWTGRADPQSVAYRLVQEFRSEVVARVLTSLTAACRDADNRFSIASLSEFERPVWQLVTAQPLHLLDPRHQTWNELLLAAADDIIRRPSPDGPFDRRTWGQANAARIHHPLGSSLPGIGRWLNMRPTPIPGAWSDVPRIGRPDYGATQRLVVSPGHEEHGLFHMPCGQSGHPFSVNYRDGHQAWLDGAATPLLPAVAANVLVLEKVVVRSANKRGPKVVVRSANKRGP